MIHHNFFIDNYSPQENVDNDDGSSYYDTHDNIYAYVGQAIGFYDAPMLDGHEDKFYNNKVVMTGTNFGSDTCSGSGATQVHDNEYFTTSGQITECGKDFKQWQDAGHDKGSSVAKTPSDDDVI